MAFGSPDPTLRFVLVLMLSAGIYGLLWVTATLAKVVLIGIGVLGLLGLFLAYGTHILGAFRSKSDADQNGETRSR